MKRFTESSGGRWALKSWIQRKIESDFQEMIDSLAAYEETGLSPDQLGGRAKQEGVPEERLQSKYCPKCGGDTVVVNSRDEGDYGYIRRRRKCLGCGYLFSTIEILAKTCDEWRK